MQASLQPAHASEAAQIVLWRVAAAHERSAAEVALFGGRGEVRVLGAGRSVSPRHATARARAAAETALFGVRRAVVTLYAGRFVPLEVARA